MTAPYQGQCLCGVIRYRITGEPITHYACHCTDCQRRTGSAFALSMVVRREHLEVLRGEPTAYFAKLPDGRVKQGRMCGQCGSRLWGEPAARPQLVVIQPGTLDQPAGLVPALHLWTREAQPWLVFPPGAKLYDTEPADSADYVRVWQESLKS
jgi:hypothetical protein